MPDVHLYQVASEERVRKAREIAEALRHDERLHRVAMAAVFVLEDCQELFARLAGKAHISGSERREGDLG